MLNETIEIDCDKEQLEEFDIFFAEECKDGDVICLKAKVVKDRLVLLDPTDCGYWIESCHS